MNNDPAQQDSPPTNQPVSGLNGDKKIIQPLDSKLTADNATSQVVTPTQSTPPQPTQEPAQSTVNAPVDPQQPAPSTSSIYPDATKGVGAIGQPTPEAGNNLNQPTNGNSGDKTITPNKNRLIVIILVTALGIYTAAPAILRLVGTGKLISLGFISSGSVFITVLDVIYFAIGVGLVLRREIARSAYVFFAIIFLLLALYGTFKVYSQEHSQSSPQGNLQVQLQEDISYCLTKTPSQQRNTTVQQLENDVNTNKQATQTCSSTVASGNQYVALIPSYLLAIIPLVFLTRPSVKQVFN